MSGPTVGRQGASLDDEKAEIATCISPARTGPPIRSPAVSQLSRDEIGWQSRTPRAPELSAGLQDRQQQDAMRKGSPKHKQVAEKALLDSARSMSPSCSSRAAPGWRGLPGGSLSPITAANHTGSPVPHSYSPQPSILTASNAVTGSSVLTGSSRQGGTGRSLSFQSNSISSISSRMSNEQLQQNLQQHQLNFQIAQQQQQQQQQQHNPLQALLAPGGVRWQQQQQEPPADLSERPAVRRTLPQPMVAYATQQSASQQQQMPTPLSRNSSGHVPGGWGLRDVHKLHLDVSDSSVMTSFDSTPCDSPASGVGSVDSPHQPAASRLSQESKRYPMPRPPSSSGGSASSTPHGATGGALQLQPHPPQMSRKSSKGGLATLQEHVYPSSFDSGSPLTSSMDGGDPRTGRYRRSSMCAEVTRSTCFTSSSAPASSSSLAPSGSTRAGASLGLYCQQPALGSSLGADSTCVSPTGSAMMRPGGSVGACSPVDEAAYRAMTGSYGSASELGLNSPASSCATALGQQRPNSNRGRAVSILVDAIRSKDLSKVDHTLKYLSTGTAVPGLNDRHPQSYQTPLSEAVMLNDMAMVDKLLAAGSDPSIGHAGQGGPLLQAAAVGHLSMVDRLLQAGADIHARDPADATALHNAVKSGHATTVQLLLHRGADVNARNADNQRPFDLAEQPLLHELGQVLAAHLAGGTDQLTSPCGLGMAPPQQQQHQQLPAHALGAAPSSTGAAGLVLISSSSSSGGLQGSCAGPAGSQGLSGNFTRRHSLTGSTSGTPRSGGGGSCSGRAGASGGTPPISPAAGEGVQLRPCPPEAPREPSSNSSTWGQRSRLNSAVENAAGDATTPPDFRGVEEERAPTPPVLTLPSSFPHLRKSRAMSKGSLQHEEFTSCLRPDDLDPTATAGDASGAPSKDSNSGTTSAIPQGGRSEAWLPGQSPLSNCSSAAQLPVSARSDLRSSIASSPASHATTPVAATAARVAGLGWGSPASAGAPLNSNMSAATNRARDMLIPALNSSRAAQLQPQQQQQPSRPSSAQQQQQQQQARPHTPGAQGDTPLSQQQPAQQQQQQQSPFANGFAVLSCGTPVRFGLPPGSADTSLESAGTSTKGSLQVPSLPRFMFGTNPFCALNSSDLFSTDGASSSIGAAAAVSGPGLVPTARSEGSAPGAASTLSNSSLARSSVSGLPNSMVSSSMGTTSSSSARVPGRSLGSITSTAGTAAKGGFSRPTAEQLMDGQDSTERLRSPNRGLQGQEGASGCSACSSWPCCCSQGASSGAAEGGVAFSGPADTRQEVAPGTGAASGNGPDALQQDKQQGSPPDEAYALVSPKDLEGVWGSCACTPPQSPAGIVSALATPPPPPAQSHASTAPTPPAAAAAARRSPSKQQPGKALPGAGPHGGQQPSAAASAAAVSDLDEGEDDVAAAAAEEDDTVAAPPLLRASSPPPVSPTGQLGELPVIRQLAKAGQEDAAKLSLAVDQLRKVAADDSEAAVEVQAAAMFGKCVDVQTDNMRWTRGGLLGEGAYGKVYAGLNAITGEIMAVKALKLARGGSSAAASQYLQEVLKELELYKNLKHEHIVRYIDARYEPVENTLFIFLEYVSGGSLASTLEMFGGLGVELVRRYTRQLLQGLEFLHERGVVHCDLKGANVLVSTSGCIKLADFGASKVYRDATCTDAVKSMRGSMYWMAPEVIRGTYGRRADIWSLGCTVIEMLSGKHPWPDMDHHVSTIYAILNTPGGPPRPPDLDPLLANFLDECLKADPKERPTAAELLRHKWIVGEGGGSS